jgi:hypothetical protein
MATQSRRRRASYGPCANTAQPPIHLFEVVVQKYCHKNFSPVCTGRTWPKFHQVKRGEGGTYGHTVKKCTDLSYSLYYEATEKICVVDICQFSTLFKLNIDVEKGRTWPKFQQVRRVWGGDPWPH